MKGPRVLLFIIFFPSYKKWLVSSIQKKKLRRAKFKTKKKKESAKLHSLLFYCTLLICFWATEQNPNKGIRLITLSQFSFYRTTGLKVQKKKKKKKKNTFCNKATTVGLT